MLLSVLWDVCVSALLELLQVMSHSCLCSHCVQSTMDMSELFLRSRGSAPLLQSEVKAMGFGCTIFEDEHQPF